MESAHPGQSEILWGNGLGPITGDDSQPPAGVDLQNMNIAVDVFVGNQPASPFRTFCRSDVEKPVGSEQTFPLGVTAIVPTLLSTPATRTATGT